MTISCHKIKILILKILPEKFSKLVDGRKHIKKIIEPGTESIKPSKYIFLTKTKLLGLITHFPVLYLDICERSTFFWNEKLTNIERTKWYLNKRKKARMILIWWQTFSFYRSVRPLINRLFKGPWKTIYL